MDLIRLFIILCCLSPLYNLCAQQDKPRLGIVFIHGTKDHRTDADGEYWKESFTRSVAAALERPSDFLIVHCDFRQYMWDAKASGCVARQILAFIEKKGIDKLIVYTHSNGSNVLRFIASNPTYREEHIKLLPHIKQVIALSPSDGGTVLADETLSDDPLKAGIGWLLGYNINAVRQQRIGDMQIYNEHLLLGSRHRPSLSLPYKVLVSSGVIASPFSEESYCNGYSLNSALKLTQLYLEKCSDGFLNCGSQMETGQLWFKDIERTQGHIPLSHNQSRHNCFALEKILIDELIEERNTL